MPSVDLSSIIVDDRPVTKLYPGWKAMKRLKVTPDVDIVHLKELETGKEAVWWLDKEGKHLASHAIVLPKDYQEKLISYVEPVLAPLQLNMQLPRPEGLSEEAEEIRKYLTSLPYPVLFEIIMLWCSIKIAKTMTFTPEQVTGISVRLDGDTVVTFPPDSISQLVATPFMTDKAIPVSSPFSGALLEEQLKFESPGGPFARFFDPKARVVFYLFWNRQPDRTDVIFYYPRGCLLIGHGPVAELFPLWVMFFFLLYNDRLVALQHRPAPLPETLPEPKPVAELTPAPNPVSDFYPETGELTPSFASDPEANITLEDLSNGLVSDIWEITESKELPPMEFPFTADIPLPFVPFPDDKK